MKKKGLREKRDRMNKMASSKDAGEGRKSYLFRLLNFNKRSNAAKAADGMIEEYMVSSELMYSEAMDNGDETPSGYATPLFAAGSFQDQDERTVFEGAYLSRSTENDAHGSLNVKPGFRRSASSDSSGLPRILQHTPRSQAQPRYVSLAGGNVLTEEERAQIVSMSMLSSPNQTTTEGTASFAADEYQDNFAAHANNGTASLDSLFSERPSSTLMHKGKQSAGMMHLDLDRVLRPRQTATGKLYPDRMAGMQGEASMSRAFTGIMSDVVSDERSEDSSPVVQWTRPHLQQFTPHGQAETPGGINGGERVDEMCDDHGDPGLVYRQIDWDAEDEASNTDFSQPMLTDRSDFDTNATTTPRG